MIIVVLALIAIPIIAFVFLFGNAWFQRSTTGGEAWRDQPPVWLTVTRPFINMLIVPLRAKYGDRFRQDPRLQQKLGIAGLRYAIEADEFVCARWIMATFITLVCIFVFFRFPGIKASYIATMLFTIPLAYYYPDIWLNDMATKRKKSISKDFPFFLELLVLSMRAGLNFSSAVSHASEKMKSGPLREEVEYFIRTVRTGLGRREALNEMAHRVALPQVSNFVAAVTQAEEVGGELGELLTKQAAQRRKERFLLAEELANKAPVKMLLPLIGILFPMTFIIIGFTLYVKARDSGALDFFI